VVVQYQTMKLPAVSIILTKELRKLMGCFFGINHAAAAVPFLVHRLRVLLIRVTSHPRFKQPSGSKYRYPTRTLEKWPRSPHLDSCKGRPRKYGRATRTAFNETDAHSTSLPTRPVVLLSERVKLRLKKRREKAPCKVGFWLVGRESTPSIGLSAP
jgi:hypothetical protein